VLGHALREVVPAAQWNSAGSRCSSVTVSSVPMIAAAPTVAISW
jgi:hypothetical protein